VLLKINVLLSYLVKTSTDQLNGFWHRSMFQSVTKLEDKVPSAMCGKGKKLFPYYVMNATVGELIVSLPIRVFDTRCSAQDEPQVFFEFCKLFCIELFLKFINVKGIISLRIAEATAIDEQRFEFFQSLICDVLVTLKIHRPNIRPCIVATFAAFSVKLENIVDGAILLQSFLGPFVIKLVLITWRF